VWFFCGAPLNKISAIWPLPVFTPLAGRAIWRATLEVDDLAPTAGLGTRDLAAFFSGGRCFCVVFALSLIYIELHRRGGRELFDFGVQKIVKLDIRN
jgi:hypothetical protein